MIARALLTQVQSKSHAEGRAKTPTPSASDRRFDLRLRTLLYAMLAGTLAVWITAESLRDLWSLGWNDAESSHVLLVPVVFLWMAWVRRGRLARCRTGGRWPGVAFMAVGWVLWREGYHYQIQAFWHFGAVALVAGSVLTVLGQDFLWQFLPTWASLLFLVPIPGRVHLYIAVPLERVTAIMTQSLAEVLGINSVRSGNQLTINGVDVSIVEACNGLRMVFTLFMACYVFAFIKPLRWWVRLIVLLMSPVVAVLCNVIRLVPTVWMFGNATASAAGRFHELAGWGMLFMAFLVLTGIANVLHWVGLPVYEALTERGSALAS